MSMETMEATTENTRPETAIAKLDRLNLAIAKIRDPETPTEIIAETLDSVQWFQERAKELREACDTAMTDRLKQSGQSLRLGKWLYSLKHPKRVKCRSVPLAVSTLLHELGGDFDVFCKLLAANPLKHGACRQVLNSDAKFNTLFETVIDDKLEKELVKTDLTFVK